MIMMVMVILLTRISRHKLGNAARKDVGFFNSPFSDVLQDIWHSCPKVLTFVASVLPAVSILPEALVYMTSHWLGRQSVWQEFFQRSPLPIQHLCASFDEASGTCANCTRELQKNMLDIMKFNATFEGSTLPNPISIPCKVACTYAWS